MNLVSLGNSLISLISLYSLSTAVKKKNPEPFKVRDFSYMPCKITSSTWPADAAAPPADASAPRSEAGTLTSSYSSALMRCVPL